MAQSLHEVVDQLPGLTSALRLPWNEYIPHIPTPKQRAFLLLPHKLAFYGGAAGGGKSDALLMGALQYVHVPRYSAIIFRKTLSDAELPNSILSRARDWLDPFLEAKIVKFKDNCFHFPSGARLQFAYMNSEMDRFRYQSAEFQYIAFDELTHFYEDDFRYLRSRLRKPRCHLHAGRVVDGVHDPLPHDPACRYCQEFGPLGSVPLRMRAASNPGGLGHLWVKRYFDIGPIVEGHDSHGNESYKRDHKGRTIYVGRNPKRPYIPALIDDNPHLDGDSYREELSELDPVTREQLLNGDWSVSAEGRLKRRWVNYYSFSPGHIVLGQNKRGVAIPRTDLFVFTIIDPAGSAREGPGDAQIFRGAPSWNVIGTFGVTPQYHLLWLDNWRFRAELPDIISAIKKSYLRWRPNFIGMEYSALSTHLYSLCENKGLPMRPIKHGSQDKLARAVDVANRMEQGRVWFPQNAPWLEDLESELFTWTGHPHEQDDQVDVLAYAGIELSRMSVDSFDPDLYRGKERDMDAARYHYLSETTPDVV